jgi:hypothetical protein
MNVVFGIIGGVIALYVRIPALCGHSFRSIADSIPVIADSW